MPGLRVACGAFLVAVLACDLTFDLPFWRAPRGDQVALDRALSAMTTYYARVTQPGSLFATSVALAMAALLASLVHDAFLRSPVHGIARFALESSLAVAPIAVAILRTLPRARRLVEGDPASRPELARAIARDHIVLLPMMLVYVGTQLYSS